MGIDAVYASADSDPAVQNALAAAWQTLSRFRIEVPQRNNLFVYFKCLDDVLTAVNDAGGIEAAEAAMGHVDYLADKAGCSPAVILGGSHFSAEQQVILDALQNIDNVLLLTWQKRPEATADAAMTPAKAEPIMTPATADAVVTVDTAVVAASPDIDPAVEDALTEAWLTLSKFRIPDPARSRGKKAEHADRPPEEAQVDQISARWIGGRPHFRRLVHILQVLNEVLIVLGT